MALTYQPDLQPQAGQIVSVADPDDAQTPIKKVRIPAVTVVDASGAQAAAGTAASPTVVQSTSMTPTAGTNLGGTVTTTSGGFSLAADATRKPGDVQGQNTGANPIALNEFGGTAVIGGTAAAPTGDANSYVVLPIGTFSITTNRQVNFIALGGSSTVAITRNY